MGYRSALHPGEANEYEPRPGNNGDRHINVGLIVAVSVLSGFAVLAIIVSLVLLSRKIRKRSRRNRDETEGIAEERIVLNVITPEENLPANDVEMDLQSHDEEQAFQANNTEEGPSSIRVGG